MKQDRYPFLLDVGRGRDQFEPLAESVAQDDG